MLELAFCALLCSLRHDGRASESILWKRRANGQSFNLFRALLSSRAQVGARAARGARAERQMSGQDKSRGRASAGSSGPLARPQWANDRAASAGLQDNLRAGRQSDALIAPAERRARSSDTS